MSQALQEMLKVTAEVHVPVATAQFVHLHGAEPVDIVMIRLRVPIRFLFRVSTGKRNDAR